MKVIIFDVEIFRNFFAVSFKENGKLTIFEFSERKSLNVKQYLKYLQYLAGKYVVGFNSCNYDDLMMNKSVELLTQDENISYLSFCEEMKDFSDLIIYGQNVKTINWAKKQDKETQLKLSFDIDELKEEIKASKFNLTEFEWYDAIRSYKYAHKWIDVDLLLYWSMGLRLTKQLSLKSIACQLNYPVIQELPIAHDALVTLDDIEPIIEYNSVHDLSVTEWLFNRMKEEVDLRLDVSKTYNLKCMSWDAPKIASEILLQAYCKEKYETDDWETLKEVRNTKWEKQSFRIGDYLPVVNFKTDLFRNVYELCCNSTDTFSHSLLIPFKDYPLKLTYSIGGIHNDFSNKVFKSSKDIVVYTSDVDSLYPQQIENLKVFRFPEVQKEYSKKKEYRLTVTKPTLGKYKALEDAENIGIWSIKDAFNKLILNGVSGLLDSKYNWLYNNIPINILRIHGQMLLSRLIEECYLANLTVISANTDGIELLLPISRKEEYLGIVKGIEKEFNVTFGHEEYKSIYYKNVNNYLAVTSKKPKQKGSSFIIKPLIGNSNDFLCIPKTINKYFVEGIKPETILNAKEWSKHFHIYDFCASYKIAKKYTVYYNGIKQQQLNRFFVSKKGYYLYKQKKGKNMENVLKGWAVELLNRYDDKQTEYNIDFKFYLSKVNEIIAELEPNQISLF